MKKSYFKICLIAVSLLLLIFSCQDEEIVSDLSDESLSIEDARSWFETNNSPIMVLKPTNELTKGKRKKPIPLQNKWKHAFKSKKGDLTVVEVALRSQYRFGFADQNAIQKFKETKNKDYHNSLSRLVILKNKKDKSINSYIMTIIGEPDYLERHNYELWSNTYFEKDKDFAGSVLFHTVDGDFVNGWKLRDGKVYGKITIKDPNIVSKKSCGTYTVTTVAYEQCTDHYNVGENSEGVVIGTYYTGTTCETWTETTTTYNACPSNSDNGGVVDDNAEEAAPDCSSWVYESNSNMPGLWQEAAVAGIYFRVYLISPEGIEYKYTIDYPQPVVFGVPTNLTFGGDLDGNSAAEATANAVNSVMSEISREYAGTSASESQVTLAFRQRLTDTFSDYVPGGRVNFNATNYNVAPTQYKTKFFGTGSCD